MLHQEAESFLCLPAPSILVALLWGHDVDLPAALLPVNGALLQLVERKGYKTHGYQTASATAPIPVGEAMQQPYHFISCLAY